MSTPKDGGPAFPRPGFLSTIESPEQVIAKYENTPEAGMTLRDWFAGQALAGLLIEYTRSMRASGSLGELEDWADPMYPEFGDPLDFNCSAGKIAVSAYQLADAMLAARKRKGDK